MNLFRSSLFIAAAALGMSGASACLADDYEGPPFDFSDSFYTANGINPANIIGRPTGAGANSIIDNRDNGPDFNNVRLLAANAAYDDSGHKIFFSVTGLVSEASFLNNSAGRDARQIAEEFKVYEFPRVGNGQFAVFPKSQDLVADMRHGYFSNDPLGMWQVNIVRFTNTALNTSAGQAYLATIAARNGLNLDGRPLVRTMDEIEGLLQRGYVTIEVPPASGGPGVIRWFFCPVLKDPRNGAIAPDAHLTVTTGLPAAGEFTQYFNCLQTIGNDCDSGGGGGRRSDCNHDGRNSVDDVFVFIGWFFASDVQADFNSSGSIETQDIFEFLSAWFAGV